MFFPKLNPKKYPNAGNQDFCQHGEPWHLTGCWPHQCIFLWISVQTATCCLFQQVLAANVQFNGKSFKLGPLPQIRFSMLHHQSRLMKEQTARPFFLTLSEIARSKPLVALLENVLGLLRIWDQVAKALQRLDKYGYQFAKASWLSWSMFPYFLFCFYFVPTLNLVDRILNLCEVVIDPLQIGDCCKRQRVYIAVIHRSVLRDDLLNSPIQLAKTLNATLDLMKVLGRPIDPTLNWSLVTGSFTFYLPHASLKTPSTAGLFTWPGDAWCSQWSIPWSWRIAGKGWSGTRMPKSKSKLIWL